MRFQQLMQFGNTYFPSNTCNSMPGWHISMMPENSIDYEDHPECRLNPIKADMGDYAPSP
jgi:hypothetical protein